MNLVTVRQLRKQYDSFLLRDVSFALESGHIAGFIGRNGAGKTTTIKAMMNLISADGGEVSFFGMPLRKHEKEIKERIGYSCGTVSFYQKKKLKEIATVTRTFYNNWDDSAYERYKNLFRLDDQKTPAELS